MGEIVVVHPERSVVAVASPENLEHVMATPAEQITRA
jgi:hypothetical protein